MLSSGIMELMSNAKCKAKQTPISLVCVCVFNDYYLSITKSAVKR